MTTTTVTKTLCDLCKTEDGRNILATHRYTSPALNGVWLDGCDKHCDQMRWSSDGYVFEKVKQNQPI
jgi:hypothetical protein